MARPGRHREQAGKRRPPAIQKWIPLQMEQTFSHDEGKSGSNSSRTDSIFEVAVYLFWYGG
jgi:hypothetical protein